MKLALIVLLIILCHMASAYAQKSASEVNVEQIKRGEYLALAGNCMSCHTMDKNQPFAGGYPLVTQFGTIYGPNITPDKETGIGTWSDDDFIRAMHYGIGKKGQDLIPVFPFAAFTQLSRDDVLAIKAYLFSLPPIYKKTPDNDLLFPLSFTPGLRIILAGWKLFNFTPKRWQPDTTKSAEYNRGMYLTEGLAHCQQCHTPRNFTMGFDRYRAFGGSQQAGWTAYNISSDQISGIGNWKDDELLRYFQTGSVPLKGTATDPMGDVIEHSLQNLTESDLRAIVTYLRSLPAVRDTDDLKPRFAWGQESQEEFSLRGTAPITNSIIATNGAELYSGNCASCHSANGSGIENGQYPSMFHNSTIGSRDPNNLIMVILKGTQRQNKATPDSPSQEVFMPGFADKLSNAEIALLSNYITRQFGNFTIPPITEEQVKQQRTRASQGTEGIWSSIKSFFRSLWQ